MTSLAGIVRSGSFAAVGTIVYSVCQFLILIAFANFGELTMLGQYALALAITAPVFMFSNMRLRFIVATDVEDNHSIVAYFAVRMISAFIAAIVVVVFVGLVVKREGLVELVAWMSLVRIFESFSDLTYGVYQKAHRLSHMAISMSMAGVGMTLAVLVTLEMGMSVVGVVIAMFLVRAAIFFAYDVIVQKKYTGDAVVTKIPLHNLASSMRIIVGSCWPLGLVALLASLNMNVPRYFVEYFLGTEELAIFVALAYVPVAGYLVVGTIGQTMMPRIAEWFARRDWPAVQQGAVQLCGFGAIVGVIAVLLGIFIGEGFLRLAYGAEFAAHAQLFVLLLAAGAVSYVVVGAVYTLTAMGRYASQISIYVSDLIIVSGLCFLFIPRMGANGGAFAMFTSQFVQVIVAIALVWVVLKRARLET